MLTMKLFSNDWNTNQDNSVDKLVTDKFASDKEENIEYPINEWITLWDGKQIFLASVYVYDEFVMFFYIYSIDLMREYIDHAIYEPPKTNRDWAKRSRGEKTTISFEYEVNNLKSKQGSSVGCLPMQMPDNIPKGDIDEFTKMYYEEYDYLLGLMKERLPEELKPEMLRPEKLKPEKFKSGNLKSEKLKPENLKSKKFKTEKFKTVTLAFRKDCYAFEEAVDKIEHFAIYPNNYEARYHFIDKTFTMPFGRNNIKIKYPAGGTQSYVSLCELKVHNMLETFEEQYAEFEKAHKNALREWEERGSPSNEDVISMDEMRRLYDKKLLVISYLAPEKHRTFEFYLNEYLDSEVSFGNSGQFWLYSTNTNTDDRLKDGLYKHDTVLCELQTGPKSEYEITLMWAIDSVQHERKAVFRWGRDHTT